MQDFTLSETGSKFIFLKWTAQRRSLFFRFLLSRRHHDVQQNGFELKHYRVIYSILLLNICSAD